MDLSHPRARLDRAAEHLRAYEVEYISRQEVDPYTLRGKLDEDTGWYSIYLIALLSEASNVTVDEGHKFPVYISQRQYEQDVAKGSLPRRRGPMHGIQHGIDLVTYEQPFNYAPGDELRDPLTVLQRFSNADKHRRLLLDQRIHLGFGENQLTLNAPGSQIIGQRITTLEVPPLGPTDDEMELARFQFAPPFPAQVGIEAKIPVRHLIYVPAQPKRFPKSRTVGPEELQHLHHRVAKIVHAFAQL